MTDDYSALPADDFFVPFYILPSFDSEAGLKIYYDAVIMRTSTDMPLMVLIVFSFIISGYLYCKTVFLADLYCYFIDDCKYNNHQQYYKVICVDKEFTCKGQTESDRLAECLCEAAIKNFPDGASGKITPMAAPTGKKVSIFYKSLFARLY